MLIDGSRALGGNVRSEGGGEAAEGPSRRPLATAATLLEARHIPALDGWRGVAIFSVMAYHLWPWRGHHIAPFVSFGWIGVDLFFVLSGFLITRILLAARERPRYFRNFYARRTLRIFPLYYAVVAAVVVAWPLWGPPRLPPRAVLPHAAVAFAYGTNLWQAYWGAWFTAPEPFHVGHFWSLAVEEQFYLVWPVVVLVVADRRKLLAACGACVVIATACRLALWSRGLPPVVPFVFTPCRLDGLGLGAALAVVATRPDWTALARSASRVTLAVTVPAMVLIGLRGHTWDHAGSHLVRTAGILISAPLCAAALFLTVTSPQGGRADRALSIAPLRWLGKYSYGLYVYHGLLGSFLQMHLGLLAWQHIRWAPAADACYFLGVAGACTAIAVTSFHLFEQPILRLKRFFPEPAGPAGTITPSPRVTSDARPRLAA